MSARSNRKPAFRIAIFLACALLILVAANALYSFTNTLRQLDTIEAERDKWQRPPDVLRALDVREGHTVADLGSGSGYFTLKLAPAVGKSGKVLAVDLRKLSLFFLWTRAQLRGQRSVHVILADEDDPNLPAGSLDSVLICNTYHEFSRPDLILKRVNQSLHAGGRVVVVDRAPHAAEGDHAHEVSLPKVEDALRKAGFEIVRHDDRFIDRHLGPQDDPQTDDLWWLVIARKS